MNARCIDGIDETALKVLDGVHTSTGVFQSYLVRIGVKPIGSMGLLYLPTFTIKKSPIHVGKYTSPMDPMAYGAPQDTWGNSKVWLDENLEVFKVKRGGLGAHQE